jgi:hypothetical protein
MRHGESRRDGLAANNQEDCDPKPVARCLSCAFQQAGDLTCDDDYLAELQKRTRGGTIDGGG